MSPATPADTGGESEYVLLASGEDESAPGKKTESRLAHYLYGTSTILLFIAAWYAAAELDMINRTLLPSPGEVLSAFTAMAMSGELAEHVAISMYRIGSGFALGLVTAIPLGLMIARIRLVRAFLEPILELIRPIPALAFLPLAILWFGVGEANKLFIMWFGTFFVIIVSVIEGVYNFDAVYLRVAKNLNANQMQMFVYVLLPGVVPFVLEGMRQAVAVSAEMIAAQAGIGFLILNSALFYQTSRVIVGIIVLGFLGMTLDRLLIFITRNVFLRYKRTDEIAI
ncbi:MAG: ABC transporter permease [Alphaproteobacteria bacterium]|nr:ABC transporter permease [Alphaproteobacteria bacterium]